MADGDIYLHPKLHFSTPAAYKDIYNASARWDKAWVTYKPFMRTDGPVTVGISSVAGAKSRRDVIHAMCSRRSVLQTEDVMEKNVGDIKPPLGLALTR